MDNDIVNSNNKNEFDAKATTWDTPEKIGGTNHGRCNIS